MNHYHCKNQHKLILLVIFVFILGCSFNSKKELYNFKYIIKIKNEGSKSESKIGFLTYKGKPISSLFTPILTPIGKFQWISSPVPWGDKGWHEISSDNIKMSDNNFMYKKEEKKWFKGNKKIGTPLNYCFIYSKNTWINPENFDDFKKEEFSGQIEPGYIDKQGLLNSTKFEENSNSSK